MIKHTFDDRYTTKVSLILSANPAFVCVCGALLTLVAFSESAGQIGHAVPALVWSASRERQQAECKRSFPIHHQPLNPGEDAT